MLDFYEISYSRKGRPPDIYYEVSVRFKVKRVKDLMVRGGAFYSVWNPNTKMWSRDDYDVAGIIDQDLYLFAKDLEEKKGLPVRVKTMENFSTGSWTQFNNLLTKLSDNYKQLDTSVAFSNTETTKNDYVSETMSYPLEEGSTKSFDGLFEILYDEENLRKLMWAIGSVLCGESKSIQKFYVLFGSPGTGKSTALNLIEQLMEGHVQTFESGELGNPNNSFALSSFTDNPLVGLDHEGDLSRIKKNSVLTSVVSHDQVLVNVKYKNAFSLRLNTTLFIATNKPVMITDKASGILRRLIDIRPTGNVVSIKEYSILYNQLRFELGAIAYKCMQVYIEFGKDYYDGYVPEDMMMRTNVIFNFIDEHYLEFARDDWINLSRAWIMYQQYCESSGITYPMQKHVFRDELRHYWKEFHGVTRVDGTQMRSVFMGFKKDIFKQPTIPKDLSSDWLLLIEQPSLLDMDCADQLAQVATKTGLPHYKWDAVNLMLKDIDTSRLHYLLPKSNLITIDFDLTDSDGEKSLELNLAAARELPPTYAEVSKGGKGLHIHYYYEGEIDELSNVYSPHIDILKPIGNFSIRRKLSLCNNHPITTINSGLPLKPDKGDVMVSEKTIKNERSLKRLIFKNLNKEIHPATKPSVDFIYKILEEAYASGLRYDVTDMKRVIVEFASNSTNNAPYCLNLALKMKYVSDHEELESPLMVSDSRLVFYDVEVFPNLLLICWKYHNTDTVVRMINPSPKDVEDLLKHPLVGFNNRRYDNHILYSRVLGYTNEKIYQLSKRIIVSKDKTAYFRDAYGLSHADVYDYSTEKKSLKHWQIELGIFHSEMEYDWDQPLSEELWEEVGDYCANDVRSTELVHHHRIEDYHAREILAELSGLRINDTTVRHTSRIIFGKVSNYKDSFVYPDLSKQFPGYEFDAGVSTYRGETVGEGGYVYAQPGIYNNVIYMDVASMYPTSIELLNIFGEYTKQYSDLKKARILIKDGKLEDAGRMFNGALAKYLKDPSSSVELAYALKIALNTVYGFTAAPYDNPFRDNRNVDNVVAKRGSLFMIDLKHALLDRGCKPIHFKTDSVKIADYDPSDILFVENFGRKYGYNFGLEGTYEKMALINDAVLVGKWKDGGEWDAVGARFARPYVFKTLFSKEPIEFEDLVETRSVRKGVMYVEMAEGPMGFVGRVGTFCPMKTLGGTLYRIQGDKKYAVTGTKGYKWLSADAVKELEKEEDIDMSYFDTAVDEAVAKIAEFGDTTIFLGE